MTNDLATRCEDAAGADRALDFWIGVSVKGNEYSYADLQADIDLVGIENMVIDAPYTASIDAALTLIPERWSYAIYRSENWRHITVKLGRSYPTNANAFSEARTPALAICAAALKARTHTSARTGP